MDPSQMEVTRRDVSQHSTSSSTEKDPDFTTSDAATENQFCVSRKLFINMT